MENQARAQLVAIVRDYGRSVVDDPRRCEALLRDLCPGLRLEVNVLVSALQDGVPSQLAGSQAHVPRPVVLEQMAGRLRAHHGLAADAARWAVESWAEALGVMAVGETAEARGEASVTANATTPAPVVAKRKPAPTPFAAVRGEDLRLEVMLSAEDASAGCHKDIEYGGQRLLLTFPPGTTMGQELRLAGQGRPGANGGLPGDAIVTAKLVATPVATTVASPAGKLHPDASLPDFGSVEKALKRSADFLGDIILNIVLVLVALPLILAVILLCWEILVGIFS